ncbi:hypothetical protein ZIOFF_038297 [Zingiber officinale]|uniref:PORR domain-containing protein n=1 Tax=Zingiber officinale TaxID=94328 RepID=A0A8J5G581_ZINOF|nr:hypothetical protein ZIOFF_038297 [Zingiber officinale]
MLPKFLRAGTPPGRDTCESKETLEVIKLEFHKRELHSHVTKEGEEIGGRVIFGITHHLHAPFGKYQMVMRLLVYLLKSKDEVIEKFALYKNEVENQLNRKIKIFLDGRNLGHPTYADWRSQELGIILRASHRIRQVEETRSSIVNENLFELGSLLARLSKIHIKKQVSCKNFDKTKRLFGVFFDFVLVIGAKITGLRRRLQRPPPCDKPFLELVSWDNDYAKSVIERRAEEEARLTGVRMRPNFDVRLPPGFYLKREMRDWTRDWLELPYISPYASTSELHPASPELEKRTVGVLHEVLSLTLLKRMAVPIIGKFSDEFQFSNAFSNAFTRHPGIFYLSLKGGIKTAMLREAYDQGELVDRDPLLEIKDQFEEMLDEGHREYLEKLKSKKEAMKRDLELMARKNAELPEDETAEI